MSALLLEIHLRLQEALTRGRDDRGDVPGWVMITVMTAAVVAALLPFIKPEMEAMLRNALASVTSKA